MMGEKEAKQSAHVSISSVTMSLKDTSGSIGRWFTPVCESVQIQGSGPMEMLMGLATHL